MSVTAFGALHGAALAIGKATAGVALVLLAARPAQDDANLRRIQALLARPAAVCGRFEQAKTLVGLRRPVRSSGRFCVVVDKGVLWTTVLPFPSALRLTKDEILESRDGQVTKRLSTHEEPTVGIINELLFSLLRGDFRRLSGSFAVTSTVDAPDWQATLVPSGGGLRSIIARIELRGGAYVREITIHDASGDRTDIVFSAIVTGPSALLPDEARQLDLSPGGTARPGGHAG